MTQEYKFMIHSSNENFDGVVLKVFADSSKDAISQAEEYREQMKVINWKIYKGKKIKPMQ
jgi:hypothetical protein